MFKKYQSGKRVYTTWGKSAEQVTVISKKPASPAGRHTKDANTEKPAKEDATSKPGLVVGSPANLFMIHMSPDEVVIDFCHVLLNDQLKAKVVSRVIMSPRHAKRFLKTLETSLK